MFEHEEIFVGRFSIGKELVSLSEKFTGDLFGVFEAFVGEEEGFGFADGVGDEAFFVEAFADVPVKGFPGALVAAFFGPGIGVEEGEGGLIDLFLILVYQEEGRDFWRGSGGGIGLEWSAEL